MSDAANSRAPRVVGFWFDPDAALDLRFDAADPLESPGDLSDTCR